MKFISKLNWSLIPALIISIIFWFTPEPKPKFSFHGLNWVQMIMSAIWLIIIFLPLMLKREK